MAILVPHARLASLLGEQTIRSGATTVAALFKEIQGRVSAEDYAKAMKCAVIVNGRAISLLDGMSTGLGPEDQVWMVFPSGGG